MPSNDRTNPLNYPCATCGSMPGEPCFQRQGTGAMKKTPHDARRRAAGEELPGRDSSPRQQEAMELGSRHFVVSGAVGALGRINHAPPIKGWTPEDDADVRTAFEALSRIDGRRRERAFIRDANKRHARELDALQNADMLNR